jgi:hypothetical protein
VRWRSLLTRTRWDAHRFGVTPTKLLRRLHNPGAPTVFCVSIPKAGTHLLERAICLHPALYRKILPTLSHTNIERYGGLAGVLGRLRPGQVVVSHLRHYPGAEKIVQDLAVRGVFLSRDPRDIVMSQVHFVMNDPSHRYHPLFVARSDLKEKIRLAIVGDPAHEMPSIAERLDFFSGWLDSGFLVVGFEELIGASGGGDSAVQRDVVGSLFRSLGLGEDPATIDAICRRLFSSASPTFRKGSIGGWRAVFDDDLLTLFRETVGDRAARYGYRDLGESS